MAAPALGMIVATVGDRVYAAQSSGSLRSRGLRPRSTLVPRRLAAMDVFLSYRRDDSHYITDRLYEWLVRAGGRHHVFKDVDSIPLGRDFHQTIREAVGRCDVLLAVIGPGWLTASQAPGMRRIDDPDDFVRMEIEAALERDIPIIPLLVNNATMPAAEDLPSSLRPLAYRNGMPVRPDPDFRRDMERLIAALRKPRSPLPRRLPVRRRLQGGAVVAALTLLCAILAMPSGRGRPGGQPTATNPPGGPAGTNPTKAENAEPKPPSPQAELRHSIPTFEPVPPNTPAIAPHKAEVTEPKPPNAPAQVVASPTVAGPIVAGEADDPPPRVKALIEALQDKEWSVRMEAANNLGQLGARAKGEIPALVKALAEALQDEAWQVRQTAAILPATET